MARYRYSMNKLGLLFRARTEDRELGPEKLVLWWPLGWPALTLLVLAAFTMEAWISIRLWLDRRGQHK